MTEFDKVIPPGGAGKVTASIHTTNFKGPVTKSVTVTTNDPGNARFTLQIKANVIVPLDVQPSENVAFNGKANQLKPQELTMTSTDQQVFDVKSVTPSDAGFKVAVVAAPSEGEAPKPKPGTVASGSNRYRITITPADEMPVGRLNASVTLATTHPKGGEQVIRIFGTVAGDVDVVPQFVTLSTGANAPPEAKVQHVAVKKPAGDPLAILGVTCDNPQVATKLTTVTEGREYDLEVRYTGEPTTTALTAKINLATNDPRQPSIDVQVWGRVDPGMRPATGSPGTPVIRPLPVVPQPPATP